MTFVQHHGLWNRTLLYANMLHYPRTSVPLSAQLAAGFIPSRDLLVKLRLRCSRSNFVDGATFAEKTITKLGLRALSTDEKNRRRYLSDLPHVVDAKPMRRSRAPQ